MADQAQGFNWVLFQWGPIQFQVYPFNVGQLSHETAADWAKKEIAGAAMYREWVGENEEVIKLKGRLFPHFFARAMRQHRNRQGAAQPLLEPLRNEQGDIDPNTGVLRQQIGNTVATGGLMHLDVIENMRRLGQSHILMRGDGWHFGWFVIESLNRAHTLLFSDGIGQQIEFEATFQRVPIPNDGAENTTQIYAAGNVADAFA